MSPHRVLLLLLPAVSLCGAQRAGAELGSDAPGAASRSMAPPQLSQTDAQLLDEIQRQTFRYFWDFAHPDCGMARERSDPKTQQVVATGGTGFGVLAILVATERGWITRDASLARIHKIAGFLEAADRFHGAWPHWLDGGTGRVIPFSKMDDGADLVETAFLVQGLLTAREYFERDVTEERRLRRRISDLWEGVEWDWFTQGQDVLFWHWSPKHAFAKGHRIRGWNECLITYVLAASSPTHPVQQRVYHKGWAGEGAIANDRPYLGITVPLGRPSGGPLFFAHYSFLCLDPRNLRDRYAHYWQQNVRHTLVNHRYCVREAKAEYGYREDCWGLTAGYDPGGYLAHRPGDRDNGTISPTAALSSMPYTPRQSLLAARYYRARLGDKLWGPYGFCDAFNLRKNWFTHQYLAIDQGPIVVMIENYRSGLLWDTFMKCEEVRAGLRRLGFGFAPPPQSATSTARR